MPTPWTARPPQLGTQAEHTHQVMLNQHNTFHISQVCDLQSELDSTCDELAETKEELHVALEQLALSQEQVSVCMFVGGPLLHSISQRDRKEGFAGNACSLCILSQAQL